MCVGEIASAVSENLLYLLPIAVKLLPPKIRLCFLAILFHLGRGRGTPMS